MSESLISVIIPARDSEKTIATALDSMINQTYRNLEIIVVDDFSTDNTKSIVEKYSARDSRVRYLPMLVDDPTRFDKRLNRNINAGYAAKNFGFENSKGDYLTSQDADDASLLNRIEVQYKLLQEHNALHVALEVFPLNPDYLGKKLDVEAYVARYGNKMMNPKELYAMSQKAKGIVAKISPALNRSIPFYYKRYRVLNKLFFGNLEAFPGAGNTCLFKREVLEKVKFRHLRDRVWPSFVGRGSDRDFNFQIVETFQNSYVFFLPLYMWDSHAGAIADSALAEFIH